MKGQTALEYLITYGWAILVILVVLAVLWYYGIFTPAKWSGVKIPSTHWEEKYVITYACLKIPEYKAGEVDMIEIKNLPNQSREFLPDFTIIDIWCGGNKKCLENLNLSNCKLINVETKGYNISD